MKNGIVTEGLGLKGQHRIVDDLDGRTDGWSLVAIVQDEKIEKVSFQNGQGRWEESPPVTRMRTRFVVTLDEETALIREQRRISELLVVNRTEIEARNDAERALKEAEQTILKVKRKLDNIEERVDRLVNERDSVKDSNRRLERDLGQARRDLGRIRDEIGGERIREILGTQEAS